VNIQIGLGSNSYVVNPQMLIDGASRAVRFLAVASWLSLAACTSDARGPDGQGGQGGAPGVVGGSNAAGSMADAGIGGTANDAGNTGGDSSSSKPYNAGYRQLTFVDSTRGRTLVTAIWYPTSDGAAGSTSEISSATPATSGGPHPLILFSHGWKGYNRQASFLTAEWARHGFVVAAPSHQYDTGADYDPSYDAEMQFDRPADIRFVVDQMLSLNQDASSFLYGMTDANAIGMSGHSFGGHTTMMIAGAPANLDHLAEYCQSAPACDFICCLQDQIQALFPGQRVIDESDTRMKAALPMAPDGYPWLQADGMARIKIPIMIMAGAQDTMAPLATEQEPMYEGILSTKYLLVLENGDHMPFADMCSQLSTTDDCPTLQAQIAEISTDFWMRYLKNDSTYGANLQSYVASQPDIDLRSTIVK
jgi:predicted dienelactone hydrolase